MSKKKYHKKAKKLPQKQLQKEILLLFKRLGGKRLNAKQISSKLGISNSKDSIQAALDQLEERGQLRFIKDGKFTLKKSQSTYINTPVIEGVVDMTQKGTAYIISKSSDQDIFIPRKRLNGALDRDIVSVRPTRKFGPRIEGEIVKVIRRNTTKFIGLYQQFGKNGIVTPENTKVPFDIYIYPDRQAEAQDRDHVLVEVTKWPNGQNGKALGNILKVFGDTKDQNLTMNSILLQNGFSIEFPKEVIEETNLLSTPTEEDFLDRLDMRDVLTFTIDPVTAKDFDDALSIQYLDDGNLQIGVHIADVTHYVKEGSALDKEALERSTSVYLVDRVCPMLPEKLSNELCSLRPNEESLTFSVLFTFTPKFELVDHWIGRTVIFSDHRFAYEEVQTILDEESGKYFKELSLLNRIAKKLKNERMNNGSIAFESVEVKFELNEHLEPIGLMTKERVDAHMLIEDFMLLANRKVGEFIGDRNEKEIPFVYRIHDEPDPEKLKNLALFAKELGFNTNFSSPQRTVETLNLLSEKAREDVSLQILEQLAIRSMAKAEYSSDNIGHFGLGFAYYSHFTSPIRRYSDVLAHRILAENLNGKTYRPDKSKLQAKCQHISVQERKAQDAERSSIKYMQAKFLSNRIGEEFQGFVSGMIDKGFFVQLIDNYCEGLLSFEYMAEPFQIDQSYLKAVGAYSRKLIKIGDLLQVKLIEVNMEKWQVEFDMVNWITE